MNMIIKVLMLEDVSHLEITEGVVPKDAIDSYFKKKRLEDFPPQAVETFYTPVYIHKNTFSTSIGTLLLNSTNISNIQMN